ADVRDVRVTAFLSRVYGWMFLGLLLTAGTAVAVASSPTLIETLVLNRGLFLIMIFAQLGVVIFLSVRVAKMAPLTAAVLFLAYWQWSASRRRPSLWSTRALRSCRRS